MRKPFSGGRTDLKPGLNSFNILFISLFLSFESPAQIPVNGFCRFDAHETQSGFTSLFPLNFNNDQFTDMLLFSSAEKKVLPLKGDGSVKFSNLSVKTSPVEFSRIQNVFDDNKNIVGYAFTSRRSRSAGIMQISPFGQPVISKSFKFDSYPEQISVADINHNGQRELLVSGTAFDGLSLLFNDGRKFSEIKVVSRTSYLAAHFLDISNDSYPDIAAFNILSSSIDFFYNNGRGHFRRVRSIPVTEKVNSFRAFDLNLDGFEDIIYSDNNSLTILYNDFTSSFEKKVQLRTKFSPDRFVMGDFNKNGKIDIAYINIQNGIISVIFAKDEHSFFNEIIYHKSPGIRHIVPFYSKFINGFAVINSSGYVFNFSNLQSISGAVNLPLSAEPDAIAVFDYSNNGINDFCFLDRFDNSLKFLIRNNDGIPGTFYSQKLFGSPTSVVVNNADPFIKQFYCYRVNDRLIEIVTADFKNNKIERSSLYVPGGIKDLKIGQSSELNAPINVLYMKGNRLEAGIFQFHDFRYNFLSYPDLAVNPESPHISTIKGTKIYYWYREGRQISLKRRTLSDNYKTEKNILSTEIGNGRLVSSFTVDLLNMEKDITVSFFEGDEFKFITISSDSLNAVIDENKFPAGFTFKKNSQKYFGGTGQGSLNKLFLTDPDEYVIFKTEFLNKGRKMIISGKYEFDEINSFVVSSMDMRNNHVIYANKKYNCISIARL